MSELSIVAAGPERLDELEPLWGELHAAHRAIAADVAPTRAVADSWSVRRSQYARWLAEGDTALLIALRGERPVGYAVTRLGGPAATWDLGARVAELETLVVASAERGAGIGSRLVAAARSWARGHGAERMTVGVAHANADALRFYRREGFAPFYELLLDAG